MPNKLNFKVFCTIAWIMSAAIGALAQSARAEAITVGDMAPDFTLSDSAGKKVTLSDAIKEAPVVLIFYRGYWCPFCAHQLSDLRDLLGKTDKARMYAVSIDPSGKTNEMIKKIEADGKGKITYSFFVGSRSENDRRVRPSRPALSRSEIRRHSLSDRVRDRPGP